VETEPEGKVDDKRTLDKLNKQGVFGAKGGLLGGSLHVPGWGSAGSPHVHPGLTALDFSALNPVSAFGNGGSEGPHMIGRDNAGTLSTNHMRAFRPSLSKAETGFKAEI